MGAIYHGWLPTDTSLSLGPDISDPDLYYELAEQGFGPSPSEAAAIIREAEEKAAAEAAERQRLAEMEAAAAAARAANQPDDFWTNVAETYVDAVDTWTDWGKEGTEYVAESTYDLPVEVIQAGGEAASTVVESTAAPLQALETPLTAFSTAAVAVAAVGALFLLRKR